MNTDAKNIMRIDLKTGCANSDGELVKGTERFVTVLFNKAVITVDEVKELINSGMYEYDSRVIVTTPTQADNLKGGKNGSML